MFTFVTGGLRSGKSGYALRRASELGPPPWLYVAAHIEGDDELKARLAGTPTKVDSDLLGEVETLADRLYRSTTPVVLVTTEIGLGFLPASVPDRRLINVAGLANQILSDRAASVVMMVSGVALRLR